MNLKKITIYLFIIFQTNAICQNTKQEFGLYNVGLGSIVGGIGAIINKKPNEKTGNVFLKGLWQGALGGAVVYQSKLLVGQIAEKQDFAYAWPASLTNSIGNSIIENACLNKNFYEQINFNVGFNRFEVYPTNNFKLKYKIMPVSLILFGYTASQTKFEAETSIKTGQFVFSSNSQNFFNISRVRGSALGNIIILNSVFLDSKSTFSHESVHVFQYYDFNFVNTLTKKPIDNLFKNSNFYNNASKFIYSDVEGLILLRSLYLAEYKIGSRYYENFFEREAAIYSDTFRF